MQHVLRLRLMLVKLHSPVVERRQSCRQALALGAPLASALGAPLASALGAPLASALGAPLASALGAPLAALAVPSASPEAPRIL